MTALSTHTHTRRARRAATLCAALIALAGLAGCSSDGGGTTDDVTTTVDRPDLRCMATGATTVYRLTTVHIPTQADIDAGSALGHNVDGVGMVCGGPDYAGGVDNALIDLAATLPTLGGAGADPVDLQAEIDAALNCTATDGSCTPLFLDVEITMGMNCADIRVLDGADASVLAGPFPATLTGGNLEGYVPELDLTIPYTTDTGAVDIDLSVSSVIMTASISGNDLTNVVIGGYLEKSAFEATLMTLVPLISDDITFDDVAGILANLYDVQVDGGCNGLSVGLTAAGSVQP